MIHDDSPFRCKAGRFDHLVDPGDRPVESQAATQGADKAAGEPNLFQTNHLHQSVGRRVTLDSPLLK
jgi:hypothetical protein